MTTGRDALEMALRMLLSTVVPKPEAMARPREEREW